MKLIACPLALVPALAWSQGVTATYAITEFQNGDIEYHYSLTNTAAPNSLSIHKFSLPVDIVDSGTLRANTLLPVSPSNWSCYQGLWQFADDTVFYLNEDGAAVDLIAPGQTKSGFKLKYHQYLPYRLGPVLAECEIEYMNNQFQASSEKATVVTAVPSWGFRFASGLANLDSAEVDGAPSDIAIFSWTRSNESTPYMAHAAHFVGGTFSTFAPRYAGQYFLDVEFRSCLKKRIPVAVSGSGDIVLNFSLINGDIDHNNEVGPSDFTAFATRFGQAFGDSQFLEDADLDGNWEIGPGDFTILATNFGQMGD